MGPGRTAISEQGVVSDAELARARQDPAFRHGLVAAYLELLLGELNKLRGVANQGARAAQISEGVGLAVRLADLLQKIATPPSRAA